MTDGDINLPAPVAVKSRAGIGWLGLGIIFLIVTAALLIDGFIYDVGVDAGNAGRVVDLGNLQVRGLLFQSGLVCLLCGMICLSTRAKTAAERMKEAQKPVRCPVP